LINYLQVYRPIDIIITCTDETQHATPKTEPDKNI